MKLSKMQVVEMQRGYSALEAFELEERRAITPKSRMAQLDAIWNLSRELRLDIKPADELTSAACQWAKLRAAIHERQRISSE